jgi:CheY-like chemotaxis protein
MVGSALAAVGYIVLRAANPREAEQLLASHIEIDILVTDIDLDTELTGLHLVHVARHYKPGIPALVVSGRSSEQFDALHFSKAGFLRKPFTPPSLLSAIASLFGDAAGSMPPPSAGISHTSRLISGAGRSLPCSP